MLSAEVVSPRRATDEELILQVQKGDAEAFKVLVSRFSGPLYNFIWRIVGDTASAQDLTQETFIKVWINRHSYREIAKFSTWIYTVAGNLAKSELRKKRLRRWIPFSTVEEGRELDFPDPSADPFQDQERRQIQRRVEEEIQKLPLVFKEVIILRDIQELSYEEIGLILKIPLGTVKSRVNRARLRLQKRLQDLR